MGSGAGTHPDRPSLQTVRSLQGPADVLTAHNRSESVDGVVGLSDHVVFIRELDDDDDGAEDLFLHNSHVRGGVGEYGGLDEVAVAAVLFAAVVHRCPLLDA